MRIENKGIKMKNWFAQSFLKAPLYSFLAVGAVMAASTEEVQVELSAKLDSVEQSKTGVSFEGSMKSRALSSDAYGTNVDENSPSVENLFYTQMDLAIKGRPSSETEATLIFRLHQDWNNYYDEGVNPINSRWMSYDGLILNKSVQFNLGDFTFKKSPLVAYNPDVDGLEYEAEVFARKREEAKSEKFLEDNKRHLQGFNATWTLNEDKPSSFAMTGTAARLRFPWWSNGVLQYDTDNVSKYLGHVDGNLNIRNAVDLGMSYSVIYDRVRTTRAHNTFNEISTTDNAAVNSAVYENNNVASLWLGYDFNQMNPSSNVILNVRADAAISEYWKGADTLSKASKVITFIDTSITGDATAGFDTTITTSRDTNFASRQHFTLKEIESRDGIAILVEFNAGYKINNDSYVLRGFGLSNDDEFVSDLAQSQSFLARSILNSQQGGIYQGQSYNTMFDALYNHAFVVNPVTARTTMETNSPADPAQEGKYSGTNNYYRAHYDKNSYSGVNTTQEERDAQFQSLLPYFQEALPNGKASANRVGGQLALDVDALDNLISADAHFGQFENANSQQIGNVTTGIMSFNRFGGGMVLRLGNVLNYADGVELSAGIGQQTSDIEFTETLETSTTENSFSNESSLYSAGVKVGFLQDFELLAGYQVLDHVLAGLAVTESIVAAGVNYNMSKGSYLTAEVTQIKGESSRTEYTQLVPQMTMTVKF